MHFEHKQKLKVEVRNWQPWKGHSKAGSKKIEAAAASGSSAPMNNFYSAKQQIKFAQFSQNTPQKNSATLHNQDCCQV